MTNYYFDVDGVLADFHSVYDNKNRAKSLTYGFIRELKPFMENIKVIRQLLAEGNDVYISSMVANEATKQARMDWLAEFLPEVDEDHIILLMKGRKVDHMKTADGVLVDDKEANCKQWMKAGHKAVFLQVKGAKVVF